jgi:hypothetical protein
MNWVQSVWLNSGQYRNLFCDKEIRRHRRWKAGLLSGQGRDILRWDDEQEAHGTYPDRCLHPCGIGPEPAP